MRLMHLMQDGTPVLTGICAITPDQPAADTAGAGGGSSTAADKPADKGAEGGSPAPRMFTQEEVDRLTAESRRQGRETGRKDAKRETDAIVKQTRDTLLEEFRAQGIIKQPPAGGAATPTVETDPAAADKSKAADKPADKAPAAAPSGDGDERYSILERRLQEQDAALKAEQSARKKLEKEREAERNERKAAQDKARQEQVITEIAGSLAADAQIPAAQARGLAKVMIAEGRVTYDDKRVLYVTDEDDVDSDDGSKVKLPLKDGIAAWGKTAAADEYRPPVRPGSGTGDRGAGIPRTPINPADMTELERYKDADAKTRHMFHQQRAAAQGQRTG